MPKVSVVIVNYRTRLLTATAVTTSLEAGAAEVIVVDNASDAGLEELLSADAKVRVLVNEKNLGFGTAANLGARDATGDALVFLNSDATMNAPALSILLSELDRWDGRAIVGPRLVDPQGVVQPSAGLLPRPSDLLVRGLGLQRIGAWASRLPLVGGLVERSRFATEHASARTATGPMDTNMISGACFAVGREAYLELGGFDERFFMYFEDADLCRRAMAARMRIRYAPDAVVPHLIGASSIGDYRFSPMHARSMRQYLEKWWGPAGAALALTVLGLRLVGHAVTFREGTGRALAAFRAAMS